MSQLYQPFREYVTSGEYFKDARLWYNHKYVHPFSQRTFIFILSIIICCLFIGVFINIRSLFPLVTPVRYSISTDTSADQSVKIIRADHIENDPLASIADIMLKNYVLHRESYDYGNLKKQLIYVKNSSTRIVFKRFYDLLSLENPQSPVLRYQKEVKRNTKITSAQLIALNKAKIEFNTVASNPAGKVVEDIRWQALIEYEIDQPSTELASNSRYNFTVIDYQLKLIEDRTKK